MRFRLKHTAQEDSLKVRPHLIVNIARIGKEIYISSFLQRMSRSILPLTVL